MKKLFRLMLTAALIAAMAATMLPPQALAAGNKESGKPKSVPLSEPELTLAAAGDPSCGENALWSLDETTGTLTISGTGAMTDYSSYSSVPWYSVRSKITAVIISGGITSISGYAFYNCANVTSVQIPASVAVIGNRAFYGCSKLQTVSLPSTLTSIGSYAFHTCSSLASIQIPSGVTTLNDYTFYGCSKLNSVSIPSGMTSIGHFAFQNCSSLTAVTLPDSVSSIGVSAFANCTSLSSINIPTGWMSCAKSGSTYGNIFNGCTSLTSLTVPAGMTALPDYAFYGCNRLQSVSLPSTLTSIGSYAFHTCSSLASIQIPSGVTTLNDYTFYGCSKLNSVSIPSGMTSIGHFAFQNCSSLTAVTLPDSVSSIGVSAFANCTSLSSINIPTGWMSCAKSGSTYGNIFNGCTSLTSLTVPAGMTALPDYAFYGCNRLQSVSLPSTLTSIGSYAFYNCSSLTSVQLPAGLTSLGEYCFYGCSGLSSFSFPSGLEAISSYAFYNCTGLTKLRFSDGLTSIGGYAFAGCTGLSSVTLPDSVSSMGAYAFRDCSSLSHINYPTSWTSCTKSGSTAGYIFSGCSKLTQLVIPEGVTSIPAYAFYNSGSLKYVTIPSTVQTIGTYAFAGCGKLTELWIGDAVTSVGAKAFNGDSSLVIHGKAGSYIEQYANTNSIAFSTKPLDAGSATLSGTIGFVGGSAGPVTVYITDLTKKAEPVTITADAGSWTCNAVSGDAYSVRYHSSRYSFSENEFIRTVSSSGTALPAVTAAPLFTVTAETDGSDFTYSVLNGSFISITGYTGTERNVIIPSVINNYTVQTIGSNAFKGNKTIESVLLPETVKTIGSSAFSGCTSLKTVGLPDSLTVINQSAFSGCTALEKISLPDSVTTIYQSAFSGCTEQTKINLPLCLSNTYSSGNIFKGCTKLTRLSVPEGMYSLPQYVFSGCTNFTQIELPASLTSIGIHAFDGCTALADISLPDGLTSIGSYAFYNCSALTALTIPDSVTSTGSYAFANCGSLASVSLPRKWTTANSSGYLFSGCPKLTTITLPEGMVTVPAYAFYNSRSIETVYLPSTIRAIGNQAFQNCTGLKAVIMDNMPGKENAVSSIGQKAFYNCTSLKDFNVPLTDDVTIGTDAFYKCVLGGSCGSGLSYEYSVTERTLVISGAGDMSFDASDTAPWSMYSPDVETLIIKGGATSIADNAFAGMEKLKSVIVPDSVTKIGAGAFSGCTSLLRVELSAALTELGDLAFDDCEELEAMIFCGEAPAFGTDSIPASGSLTVYYPKTELSWNSVVASNTKPTCYEKWDNTLPTRDIVLALDCSGSMAGTNISALKTAVNAFIDKTGGRLTNTRIAVVPFADSADVSETFTTDIISAEATINALSATGGTYYTKALNACDSLLDSSTADIKSLIFFSDGEPSDSTSGIYSAAAAIRGSGVYVYTVGLCSAGTSYEKILINVAGSENNYFAASDIDALVELFASIDGNIGKSNKTAVTMTRGGKDYDLQRENQFFSADSTEAVNITVTPYWAGSVAGSIRLTQSGRIVASNDTGVFTDIIPAKAFSPIETVYATLVDSSGSIVTMKKLLIEVEVAGGSRLSLSTNEVAVTVYQNKNDSSSRDDNYILSSGATVTADGADYTTDRSGVAVIPALSGNSITVSKAGHISRSITADQLSESTSVYLQKSSSKAPVVLAVWIGNSDVLSKDYPIGLLSDQSVTLTAEADWGSSSYGSISLVQEARAVKFSGNTLTTVLKNNFDVSEKIYIAATDAAGRTTKKALKFSPGEVSALPKCLDGASFSLSDSLSITLPDNIKPEFFAGSKVKFGVSSMIPITMSAEDGKVYVAIGVDLVSYSKSNKWASSKETGNRAHVLKRETETFIDKFKDTGVLGAPGAAKNLNKLKNLKQTYKTAMKYPQGSFGFDADLTILGFAEGYYDSQGSVTWLDGGIILNPSVSWSWNLPFALGPIPMYFEASISGDVEAQLNIIFNEAAKNFTPNGEISGTLTLGGGVGAGIKKVLYLGGGLEGKLKPDWKIYVDAKDYFKLTASVNAYAKIGIVFFEYKKSWDPFYNAVWVEVPKTKGLSLSGADGIYDAESYKVKDLSYLDSVSSFTANRKARGLSLSSLTPRQSHFTDTVLKTNIYRESTPRYVSLPDGTALAVWPDSASSDLNGIKLYYSSFDGSSWSDPAVVYDDGTLDYAPYMTVIDDIPWLIWQNATKTFTEADTLETVAPWFDICAASFDPVTGFTVQTIENAGLDMLPTICGKADSIYAVWVNNGQNDWFGRGTENSIVYSKLTGGVWSSPVSAYTGLNAVDSLSADHTGRLHVAYAMDTDGNIETIEDMRVFENGARVTDSDSCESLPVYHDHVLYWNAGGTVISTPDEIQEEIRSVGDYQIFDIEGQKALVYTVSDGLCSALNVSYYNEETGQWAEPIALTDGSTFIGAFSACEQSGGTVSVLCNSQSVDGGYTDDDPYGSAELRLLTLSPYCDLTMGELMFSADEYSAGDDMRLDFALTNNGVDVVDGVTVLMTDAQGGTLSKLTIDGVIVPGETVAAATMFSVDPSATGQTVTVTVTPKDQTQTDVNTADNGRTAVLAFEDLSVEDALCGVTQEDMISVNANVVNRGYECRTDIVVELRKDTADGEVVAQETISSLDPLSLSAVSFLLSAETEGVYYVSVKDSGDEYIADDEDFVVLTSTEPGDAAAIDSVSSESAQVYLNNDTPCTCIIAVYDENGRMLTSGTSEVGADAGDTEIIYSRVVLPTHYTVKLFLLDGSKAPICEEIVKEY